jgi:hypothetical protein
MTAALLSFLMIGSCMELAEERTGATNPWQSDRLVCKRQGVFPLEAWSIAGIQIGGSTLKDVERRLGAAERIRPSRDEAAPDVLCYDLGKNRIVVFESSSLATVEGEVTAMSLLQRSYVPFVERCAAPNSSQIDLPPNAGPGATREGFENLAGRDYCHRDATATEWNFEQLEQEWSRLSGLKAHFAQEKLAWWHAYSVRSR